MKIDNLYIDDNNANLMIAYIKAGIPFMLEGPPGIGKSLAAKVLGKHAYKEMGVDEAKCPPLKIDITEDTEVRHLIGEVDYLQLHGYSQALASEKTDKESPEEKANKMRQYAAENCFREGPLTQACRDGRLLIVEELDRAGRDTLFSVFFDPIEYKRVYVPEISKTIEGSQGKFNIIITVNRSTDVGTVRLPGALLRRLRRVQLYDPTTRFDAQSLEFESQVVIANVEHHLQLEKKPELDEQQKGQLKSQIQKVMLNIVWKIRQNEIAQGMAVASISPSEVVCIVMDIIRIHGLNPFLESAPNQISEYMRGLSGAIAKDEEELLALNTRIEEALQVKWLSEPEFEARENQKEVEEETLKPFNEKKSQFKKDTKNKLNMIGKTKTFNDQEEGEMRSFFEEKARNANSMYEHINTFMREQSENFGFTFNEIDVKDYEIDVDSLMEHKQSEFNDQAISEIENKWQAQSQKITDSLERIMSEYWQENGCVHDAIKKSVSR